MSARRDEIRRLRRTRPRSRFVRVSLVLLGLLAGLSSAQVVVNSTAFLTARRMANLDRFLTEIRPFPLRDRPFDFGIALDWAWTFFRETGASAMATTLAISVAAAVLAGAAGLLLSFLAARNFMSPEPFVPDPRPPGPLRRGAFRMVVSSARSFCVLVRALPEYVWGFLLLAMLGPTPWAAVIALAARNAGILGRLNAETIENLSPGAPGALRRFGATRAQIAAGSILPAVMPRFLLYFFYRWETCVREATVLGMLGIVSLGYWIDDARARNHYDEMFLLVLLGAFLVVAGDLVSALARRLVRRAA